MWATKAKPLGNPIKKSCREYDTSKVLSDWTHIHMKSWLKSMRMQSFSHLTVETSKMHHNHYQANLQVPSGQNVVLAQNVVGG